MPESGLLFEVPVVFDKRPSSACEELPPGSYDLLVRGSLANQSFSSNVVTFTVAAPSGEEATVRAQILSEPAAIDYLSYSSGAGMAPAAVRQLMREHPDSAYLAMARVEDLADRTLQVLMGCEPDTSVACTPDPEAVRGLARAMVPEAEDVAARSGAWKPGALGVLAILQGAAGQTADRLATLRRLASDHGDRRAGVNAAEEVVPEP